MKVPPVLRQAGRAGRLHRLGDHEARGRDLLRRRGDRAAEQRLRAAALQNRCRGDWQARFGLHRVHRPHSVPGFVTNRPGHDQRYAIDCGKLKRDLGWSKAHVFDLGLRHTVRWYLEYRDWVESVRTGEYRKWIEANCTELEWT